MQMVLSDISDNVDANWYQRHVNRDVVAYSMRPGLVKFPTPRNININMMPFRPFDSTLKIPEECLGYAPLIYRCRRHMLQDYEYESKIAYLTIHESAVPVGQSQRRPGLHVERPGAIKTGKGGRFVKDGDEDYKDISWGLGHFTKDGIPTDGIFMASSVADSCAVWPLLVTSPGVVTDLHGGIEQMRPHLGPGNPLPANTLCWITDRTPHESLPLRAPPDQPGAATVYRQFFRLVVGPISVWYSRHNTPNPFGIQPDAPIVDEDKFAEGE